MTADSSYGPLSRVTGSFSYNVHDYYRSSGTASCGELVVTGTFDVYCFL